MDQKILGHSWESLSTMLSAPGKQVFVGTFD